MFLEKSKIEKLNNCLLPLFEKYNNNEIYDVFVNFIHTKEN